MTEYDNSDDNYANRGNNDCVEKCNKDEKAENSWGDLDSRITGVYFLLVVIISNHVGSTINNSLSDIIRKNYLIRMALVFVVIFFTINFTATSSDMILDHLIDSLIMFVLYLCATKSHISTFLVVCFLIIISHVINNHISYLERENKKSDTNYQLYSDIIKPLIILISIGGCVYKIHTMRRGKNFSVINYLLNDN